MARRAEGHGGGGQRGGRGCLDVGTRGGTELGGLQGLGEHGGSGAREGARGRGKEHEGWGGGTGRGGGTGGSEHLLRGVPPLTGAEDVPVRHQLRQRPRTVLLHPAGHSAQRGPTPTPAPRPRRPPGPGPAPRQVPPARPRHGPARARPRERGGSAGTAAKGRGLEGAERGNRGWERGNGVARRRWREREGAAALSSGLSCAVSSDLPARECHPVDAASIILTLGRSIPTPFSWSQRTGEWRRGGSSPFPPPCSTGPGGAPAGSSRAELSNDKLHFI